MSLIKTKGITLHYIKYAETSVIVKIYTEKLGLQSFILKGINGKKSVAKRNLLSPLSIVDCIFDIKESRKIQFLKEIQRNYAFSEIGVNMVKNTIVLFVSEIVHKSIQEQETNPILFAFLENSIKLLDSKNDGIQNFPILFLINFSKHLGFSPKQEKSNNTYFDLQEGLFTNTSPNHTNYIDGVTCRNLWKINEKTLNEISNINISLSIRRQLIDKLILYYSLHLPNLKNIRSHKILQEVLDA